ncbi:MAG: hypothetical protein QW734_01150 [Candidatus Bathyarchaeia archaeon]
MTFDTIAFAAGLVLIALALLYAGLQEWLAFWFGFLAWLGAMEWYLDKKTGKTLSERFGELMKKSPKKAYAVIISFWLAILALTWHLIAVGNR